MNWFKLKARELATNKIYEIIEMHFTYTTIDVIVQIQELNTYGQKALTIYKNNLLDNEVELIFE